MNWQQRIAAERQKSFDEGYEYTADFLDELAEHLRDRDEEYSGITMSDTTKNGLADGLIPARLATRTESEFVRELRTLARQQVKGSEFGPDEHILWYAADHIKELEAQNRELCKFQERAIQRAIIKQQEEIIESLQAKLARKISLPRITDDILSGWRGRLYLLEEHEGRWDWTQDAVDFAALIGQTTLEQDDG